jgi:hypothetical protein
MLFNPTAETLEALALNGGHLRVASMASVAIANATLALSILKPWSTMAPFSPMPLTPAKASATPAKTHG